MTVPPGRAALADTPESVGRTTATLVASLTARLTAIHLVSGGDAIGSLVAGFAELGQEVSKTAEGARLRSALARGRAGVTGDLLWSRLRIEDWASSLPPSPVLDQLRNDVALLLAEDVEEVVELLPIPGEVTGRTPALDERWTFLDFVVGFWAFSREVVSAVEALAAPTLGEPGAFTVGTGTEHDDGAPELLR